MTYSFNPQQGAGQQQQQQQPQGNPTQTASTDPSTQQGLNGFTQEQLSEIVKRDEHAQRHISNIETENAGMRKQLEELQSQYTEMQGKLTSQQDFQELIKGLNQNSYGQQQQQQTAPAQQQEVQLPDFDKLVSDKINGFMSSQQEASNMEAAAQKLGNLFGVKADEHVTKIAQQNGMTFEDASEMSKHNPTLFENLFIKPFNQGSQTPAPTSGSQSQGSQAEQTINIEYWNKLRRENPSQFWSVPVQKEYHKWFHAQQNNQ